MTENSKLQTNSLKKKLLISIIFNVTIAFTVATILIFYTTQRLSSKFIEQSQKEIASLSDNFKRDSLDSIQRIERIYEEALQHQAADTWRQAITEEKKILERNLTLAKEQNKIISDETMQIRNESMTEIYFLLVFGLLGIFDVVWGFSRGVTNKVTKPILRLKELAEEIARGNYKQNIDINSDDEIGVLADAFQKMSDAITKRDDDLAEINRNLENLVKERTLQLNEQLTLVSDLLNNMKQAVFSVSKEHQIVLPVSKFANELFKTPIDGRNIFDLVYKDLDRKSEDFSKIQSTFSLIFNEEELQWVLLENQLPTKLTMNIENNLRTLKISYHPLWNNQRTLEKLMYVIEDITDVLELEKKVEVEKAQSARNIQLLQEMGHHGLTEIKNFFQDSFQLLTEIDNNLDNFNLTRRNLHTLKGNARSLGLLGISGTIHQIESETSENFRKYLPRAKAALNEYFQLAKNIFKLEQEHSSDPETVEIYLMNFTRLRNLFEESRTRLPFPEFKTMLLAFDQLFDIPVKSTLAKNSPMIREISAHLGKQVEFKIQGDDISLNRKKSDLLNNAAGHILRNALDHAIETPETRKAQGKPEKGSIAIECRQENNHFIIKFKDDGKGIDSTWLAQQAVSRGLISPETALNLTPDQKLNLIFISGFSTHEITTEISGRGVGMDAVRDAVNQLGGNIQISSRVGEGTEIKIEI